jgi:hypothetical protein
VLIRTSACGAFLQQWGRVVCDIVGGLVGWAGVIVCVVLTWGSVGGAMVRAVVVVGAVWGMACGCVVAVIVGIGEMSA